MIPSVSSRVGPLRGDGAQVLPVVAQVEGVGELLARPQPAQPGLGAVRRSLGFLAVPPADRDDHRSAGQGELVQVVVVAAGERVVDRLADCANVAVRAAISARPGLGRKSPVCMPCTSPTVIARSVRATLASTTSRPASKPRVTQISGPQLAHRTTSPPDEGCSEAVFGRRADRREA
jgi:hypothetical protein